MEVRIEPQVFADILLAVHLTPVEVSGLGKVVKDGEIYMFCGEVVVFKQTCSLEETNFMEDYGRWQQELMLADREKEIEDFGLWWHSHVYAPSLFSRKDARTIDGWKNTYDDWWFSLIANKRGEINLRFDVFRPRRLPPTPVKDFRLTEALTKNEMESLILEREGRMREIIRQNVTIVEDDPLEQLLKGVYGE